MEEINLQRKVQTTPRNMKSIHTLNLELDVINWLLKKVIIKDPLGKQLLQEPKQDKLLLTGEVFLAQPKVTLWAEQMLLK